MKKIFFFLCASLSFANFANDKIINGTEASFKDFPFIVSVGDYCGGSVIGKKWILTAAHCAPFDFVRGGADNLESPSMKRYEIKRTIFHPDKYEREDGVIVNDIALLELEEEIDFDQTGLAMIEFADKEFEANGGQNVGVMATVAGWGVTHPFGTQPSDQLLEVSVPIAPYEKANAKNSYDGAVDVVTMFPAGFDEGGKDSCSGDSGGPLVVESAEKNKKIQIGIVSWGDLCAAANFYGVYVKVSYFSQWIHSHIK